MGGFDGREVRLERLFFSGAVTDFFVCFFPLRSLVGWGGFLLLEEECFVECELFLYSIISISIILSLQQ